MGVRDLQQCNSGWYLSKYHPLLDGTLWEFWVRVIGAETDKNDAQAALTTNYSAKH